MNQRISTWMSLLLLVLSVLSCGDSGIEVNVTGLPSETKSLLVLVSLRDRPAQVLQPINGRLDSFRIQVPSVDDVLTVQVGAIGETGCRLAEGSATQAIPTSVPMEVPLSPTSASGCSIAVEFIGDGQGRVVSEPAGIDCPTTCTATFAPGTNVTLRAIPASDVAFFSGWSQSCSGSGLCLVRVSDAQTVVRAGFLPSKVCRGAFCWESPLPQGNILRAVFVRSANDAWAVGGGGTILHWFGSTWAPVRSSTSVELWAIYGRGEELWVVGDGGTILHYDGREFSAIPSPTTASLRAISANATELFIAGDNGTLLHGSGSSFSAIVTNSKEQLLGLSASTNDVWAVGSTGTVLRYRSGRVDQIPTKTTESLNSVAERVPGEVWIAGDNGTLLAWNGTAFSLQDAGTSLSFHALWVSPSSELWLVADSGVLRRFDGKTWTSFGAGAAQNLFSMHGSSASEAWAAGDAGILVHWNGVTWTPLQNLSAERLLAIGSMDGSTLLAVGSTGIVRQRTSGVWHKMDGGPGFSVTKAWIGLGEIWAVSGSLLFRFAVIPPETRPRWTAYNFAPYILTAAGRRSYDPTGAKIDGFAVSQEGVLFGITGSVSAPSFSQRTLVTTPLRAVASTSTTEGWALGDVGVAIHLIGPFAVSEASTTAVQLWALFGLASDDVWAVGEGGTILHWNGSAWSKISSGTTVNLRGVWASSASDVWVVGESGTVLSYDGKSFSRVSSGTSSDLYSVSGGDNGNVMVAGESGAILSGGRASFP